MRIVDLSLTVEECDSAPFAKDEYYFKLRPIVTWEEKGFVSNLVEMTVHAGTHIDSPHHFFRHMPGVEQIPLEAMIGDGDEEKALFKVTASDTLSGVSSIALLVGKPRADDDERGTAVCSLPPRHARHDDGRGDDSEKGRVSTRSNRRVESDR
jgi:hypothetical protein